MRALPVHLEAGADLRASLEQIARLEQASGFVLSVVGNMRQACFACPGQDAPTVLQGELEIITLQGTLSPEGVHLHLSFSDPSCQMWGGHLEHGSEVLKGADILIGWLQESPLNPGTCGHHIIPHIQVALAEGCAWSRRTERLLNGLGLAYEVVPAGSGSLPQISIDGRLIGGYSELAALHTSGALSALIHG